MGIAPNSKPGPDAIFAMTLKGNPKLQRFFTTPGYTVINTETETEADVARLRVKYRDPGGDKERLVTLKKESGAWRLAVDLTKKLE
jgi:hypothetical protein